jgi:hypothetical protein
MRWLLGMPGWSYGAAASAGCPSVRALDERTRITMAAVSRHAGKVDVARWCVPFVYSAWNGIWLPNSRYTKLHSPRSVHAGSHPAYSEPLKKKLGEYVAVIQARIDNGEPLEDVMIDVERAMQRLNDRLRKALVPPESKAIHYNRQATQDVWEKIIGQVLP